VKDLFSKQAGVYAKYRPGYPLELINYILSFVKERDNAWDAATGNGQAARLLAPHFKHVSATDMSEKQLEQAIEDPRISFSVSSSEKTSFAKSSFDLVTVAQAYHWFNFEEFKNEVMRVGKPGSILAIWGYGLIHSTENKIQDLILHFYKDVVGQYWDPERRYVDEEYRTIPFPYADLPGKNLSIEVNWSIEDLAGYCNSWSSVQHYIKARGENPVDQFHKALNQIWSSGKSLTFSFPSFLRLGKIHG
jgi:SAM-dependent methyltransferase